MTTLWRIIDSGPCDAAFTMALDEAIAIKVRQEHSPPTLRTYGWSRRSVSLGYFQRSADLDIGHCRENEIDIVRRPTGGRAVLHGDEITYSFSVQTKTGCFSSGLLDSYERISSALMSALSILGLSPRSATNRERTKSENRNTHSPLCFQSVSFGEISINGMKVIGSAQKRWGEGLLQQGSIPLTIDEDEVFKIFQRKTLGMERGTFFGLKQIMPDLSEEALKSALRTAFEKTFHVALECSVPTREELSLALDLAARKYRADAWTFRR